MRELPAIGLDTLLGFKELATACDLTNSVGRKLRDAIRAAAGLGSNPSIPVRELLEQTEYFGTPRISLRLAITGALAGDRVYMRHKELNYLFGNQKTNVLRLYDLPRLQLPSVADLKVIRADIRAMLHKVFPGEVDGLMDGTYRLAGPKEITMYYRLRFVQIRDQLATSDIPFMEVPAHRAPRQPAIFVISPAPSTK